jgi:hypothetical protein
MKGSGEEGWHITGSGGRPPSRLVSFVPRRGHGKPLPFFAIKEIEREERNGVMSAQSRIA